MCAGKPALLALEQAYRRSPMRSPGALQLYACYPRFNLSKTFKITERHNVNLRAEFINLNTPILNAPNTGIGS